MGARVELRCQFALTHAAARAAAKGSDGGQIHLAVRVGANFSMYHSLLRSRTRFRAHPDGAEMTCCSTLMAAARAI
jgi:hypothetical protein